MALHFHWLSNQTPFTLYFENSQRAQDATSAGPGKDVMTGVGGDSYSNVPFCSAHEYFYDKQILVYAVDNDQNIKFSFSLWSDDKENNVLQYSSYGVYYNVQALPTYGNVADGFG